MQYFHILVELAAAYAHERDTVAVSLVHVSLDLEYERGELRVERVNYSIRSAAGQWGSGHFKEVLKERLNAEIRQCRTEEHR